LYAAKLLAVIHPLNRIILVARDEEKAAKATKEVRSVLPDQSEWYTENIIPLVCDHTSLNSVREFNLDLRRKLKEVYHDGKWAVNGIDVMCLNAAVLQAPNSQVEFTNDGMETTFQTNYLAPFLIANLTADLINPGGRVVVSSSGLHYGAKLDLDGMIDPCTGNARKGFSMINGHTFHFKESYSLSKLSNVAFCVELNQRLQSRQAIVNSFSPGLMTKSGLFRNQDVGSNPTSVHSKEILKKDRTVEFGAGALVFMAMADATGERGGVYWRDVDSLSSSTKAYGNEFSPSAIVGDAYDKEKREQLWNLSCQLVGISKDFL
jgi:protochlorophyllide reductase